MDKKELRESFIKQTNTLNKIYHKVIDLEYDYEVNSYVENGMDNSQNDNIKDKFCDELAPRFYKCEDVKFFKKKWIKSLVSKNKIRFINSKYDLDLV
jgi:hypothetical protein